MSTLATPDLTRTEYDFQSVRRSLANRKRDSKSYETPGGLAYAADSSNGKHLKATNCVNALYSGNAMLGFDPVL